MCLSHVWELCDSIRSKLRERSIIVTSLPQTCSYFFNRIFIILNFNQMLNSIIWTLFNWIILPLPIIVTVISLLELHTVSQPSFIEYRRIENESSGIKIITDVCLRALDANIISSLYARYIITANNLGREMVSNNKQQNFDGHLAGVIHGMNWARIGLCGRAESYAATADAII